MRSTRDRIAIALALLSVLTLTLGLFEAERAFSVAVIANLMLPLLFGWRRQGRPVRMRLLISACGVLFAGLLLAIFYFDHPEAQRPDLWLGYPRATAIFVYLLWPLSILPAVIYALFFPKNVLDDADLSSFMKRYSKHRAADRHGA